MKIFTMNRIGFFVLILILSFSAETYTQDISGVVTYNRKTDWISIMSKLPWITQEDVERDRLTWGSRQKDWKGQNYDLFIDGSKSVYTYKEEQSEGGYSWKKEKYFIVRDFKSNKTKDLFEHLGKSFLIEEEIPKHKWKILNEIREIEGYLCMKAETKDAIRGQTIHAWFTDAIPFSGGPEGFGGLPGLILEINKNDGDAVITASKVNLESVDKPKLPKKMKGKEVSYTEFNQNVEKYIADAMEREENPFWRIRY